MKGICIWMRKVCHITSVHKSQDVRILKKQCRSLAMAGYETYLVAPGDTYIENNVNIVGIGETIGGRVNRMLLRSKSAYKKALELDCDIYQIHDPELLPYALKLKRRGKKVIFDSHENYIMQIKEKEYIPSIFRWIIASGFSAYQKHVLKKIDAVIFPCTLNGKDIFEGLCRKSITLGNQPMLDELYNKYNPNEHKNEKYICHVGGLTYNRGIEHLVKSAEVSKTKLVLGGGISDAFKSKLEELSAYKYVDNRGFCNRDEVLEIYTNATIGACTLLNVGQYNKYDNFATKVYEYMALGLPVILSDYPYARKVIEKYNFAILVDPTNIDEIADAITYLNNNPELCQQMGDEARRAIKEEFNWEIEEKKLISLYLELNN